MLILRVDDDLSPLVAALRHGETAAIPTDTVYGLACAARLEGACRHLLEAKGRDPSKASSILVASVSSLLADVLPEAPPRTVRALLPGPLTLVLPNPQRRYPWLCGDDPDRIGVRVPDLPWPLARALEEVGAVLATSANRAGEPPALRLEDLDPVADAVAVAVDGGPSPGGSASTVVDLTGAGPVILREGPVSLDDILARL
jgi:tRNA threonylcarbamoyl adenosine modification protein (Sua5/YciO/YrdC/YwlC family)